MTRTPPQHGERRCYLRGCRRPECVDANARYCKRYNYDVNRNGPRRYDATKPAAIATELAKIWSHTQIAEAADCAERVVFNLVHGRVRTINPASYHGILAAPAKLTNIPGAALVDPTGTVRRGRALIAIGYERGPIAEDVDLHADALGKVLNGARQLILGSTAQRMIATYRALSTKPGPSVRSRRRAARLGWAPPAAWDDDTIDNPQAYPDWTGHCGTDRGWWMHTLQKLPMCQPCEQAHEEWKQQHKHLPPAERISQLGKARAAASSRGQDIADDAHELLRLGYRHDVIADRLGITLAHLHQELKRHPEPTSYEAAA